MHSIVVIEKKSLAWQKKAPAYRSKSSHPRVDLTRPAPVRSLAACSSGKHIKKVTIE
jgi:hypothetical protein